MKETRVVFSAPGMSKAELSDLLGGLKMAGKPMKVDTAPSSGGLNTDPATVALIGAAGLLLVELIKSATQIYLEHKKASAPQEKPTAQVTVHLTLGGRRTARISNAAELTLLIPDLPSDPAEIRRIQLE